MEHSVHPYEQTAYPLRSHMHTTAGVRGGGFARRGGEGSGQGGAGRKRGGWWAARGFRTWAERPNAGPHVGEEKKKHGPSFSGGGKTQNLRSRVFLATLITLDIR
jgi:hypothetical protein